MNASGYAAELALCTSEGLFLGVQHTWCSCDVVLSSHRRNEHVFTMSQAPPCSSALGEILYCLRACNGTYLCMGSKALEHEREVGTSVKPFFWRLMVSRLGFVALYSLSHGAFLRNDLSLHQVPVVTAAAADKTLKEAELLDTLPACTWLSIPVPLNCAEGQAESSFSVTKLLHWGHESAVLLTEHSSLHEASVAKSIPCERASAIRRIDALMYQTNMPGAADSSNLFCPMLSKMTTVSPSFFYTQIRCFRSLEHIFAEHAIPQNDTGIRHMPLSLSLEIIRRIIEIISSLHALGFVLLDATPSSFCESQRGSTASLQLTDMKNVMKLEPKTYSTPASFLTKSGGRFGVPTGLFVMVPQPSLFLGHLHANCLFAAPEVLQTPGSVGVAADVFSIACIFAWMVTGAAPCAHMSLEILKLGSYSDQTRALVPSLISAMHEPTQQGDYLVPDSSAASSAIVAATRDAPALTKLVLAALSFEREKRPGLAEFCAGVDAALAHVNGRQDAAQ